MIYYAELKANLCDFHPEVEIFMLVDNSVTLTRNLFLRLQNPTTCHLNITAIAP